MIIISWDVGIIHLAYCVLELIEDDVRILAWDQINLVEDDRIVLTCQGETKIKSECGKNAKYYLNVGTNNIGFCKTHLSQHAEYWSEDNTKDLFKKKDTKHQCTYLKNNGTYCGKKCSYIFKNDEQKHYYCTTHYKSECKKKIKEYSPKPIKNIIIKKYPTSKLQLTLIKKLDSLSEYFASLNIEEVIIENQPTHKNPKMKSISNTLFDYFLIRGYIDKKNGLDISLVRFMCPSNKLKVNNDNTLEVFKANKDETKKYKLTKALSIKYTKKLLKKDKKQLRHLKSYKKKDDMCDAYLQGRYYLEFVRN